MDRTHEELGEFYGKLVLRDRDLSHKDAIAVLGLAISYVASGVDRSSKSHSSLKEGHPREVAQAPQPVPENHNPSGPVLANKGDKCYCTKCGEAHYEVINVIHQNGMSVPKFVKSFRTLGKARDLNRDDFEVYTDEEGSIFIDCPVCSGKKTLRIIKGEKVAKKVESPIVEGGFGSMDPKVLGIPSV